jgi:hypothetical protein
MHHQAMQALQIAVLVIVALLLLLVVAAACSRTVKLLILRTLVRAGLKDIGERALARQPDFIHLVPKPGYQWKKPDVMQKLVEPLHNRGFVDVEIYAIPELPGVTVQFLLNSATDVYACVYEHDKTGNWAELVSRYQDGTGATFTMLPDRGFQQRPQNFLVHAPGTEIGALYDRMIVERPQRPMIQLTPANLAPQFEKVWAEQIAWRKRRGAKPEEVAKIIASRRANTP